MRFQNLPERSEGLHGGERWRFYNAGVAGRRGRAVPQVRDAAAGHGQPQRRLAVIPLTFPCYSQA